MKFQSNIFYDLARCLGLTTPDSSGTLINVPPELISVITVREPLIAANSQPSATIQRASFNNSAVLDVNAGGGGIGANVNTLGKGLWEINIMGSSTANYVGTSLFEQYIALSDPTGGMTAYLLGFKACGVAATPIAQWGTRTVVVLLDIDGYLIVESAVNNAAGQRMTSGFQWFANKLL
jgi:hypothetical protein